jgi:hypothetical protein
VFRWGQPGRPRYPQGKRSVAAQKIIIDKKFASIVRHKHTTR